MHSPARAPRKSAATDVRHFIVSSHWLQRGDTRLDATTYSQESYAALRALEKCPYERVPLGTLVTRVYHPTENQPRSNFKRIWVGEGDGVPFLTGRQLLFFRPEREKFISRKMRKLNELLIKEGTLLVTRSGTTGNPVLVNKWLAQFAITDDALRIFPGDAPIGYIYAYLASSIGQPLMAKSDYGSTVSHLEAKHVASLPVPLVPKAQQEAIHEQVIRAASLRDQANRLLDDAEVALYDLVGVTPFSDADIEYLGDRGEPRAFAISSAELGVRLDATHHVPIARSATKKLESGRFPLIQLGKRVKRVYVAPRFARIYVDEEYGTPLLQGSHLPQLRPLGLKFISNSQTDRMQRWIIRKGWVLVTCSGTIGRVAIATSRQDGWAASQYILRIVPKANTSHPGFVAAFLATPYGQHQLNAKIYGGVVDELTAEDTAKIMIPDVPYRSQAEVGDRVVQAYELRDEANEIEDAAVREFEKIVRGAPLNAQMQLEMV